MSRSKAVLKIVKIEQNLKKILAELKKTTYKEPFNIAKKERKMIHDLNDDEYQFIYKWNQNEIKETVFEFDEDKISVIIAVAVLESTKRITRDKGTGKLLPKADRINTEPVKVIFFEHNKKTYALINTSNETYSNRVKKLIGIENITDIGKDYTLSEDLFSWLVYIHKEHKKVLNNTWRINNITGFIGNAVDEDNIFKGTSDYTTDLIITKAFMSNGESLTNVTVQISNSNNDVDFIFSIDNQSNTTLLLNRSLLFWGNDENSKIIYLYTVLIPIMKSIYDKSKNNYLNNQKSEFLKKMGLEVIDSIVEKNNLIMDTVVHLIKNNELSLDEINLEIEKKLVKEITAY